MEQTVLLLTFIPTGLLVVTHIQVLDSYSYGYLSVPYFDISVVFGIAYEMLSFSCTVFLCRVVDHDYVSQRAHEERKNRSQYKPIIDHDGIHWEKSRDQVPDNIIVSR